MSILLEMTSGETSLRKCKIIEVKILEVDIEIIIETTTLEGVEAGLGKDNIQVIVEGMTRAVAVGLDQVQEPILTDRIRCFRCREYEHFAKDCPNSQTEKRTKQNTTNV